MQHIALSRRWARLLSGLFFVGLGTALMVAGQLGLGPWDVLHQGIAEQTGLPIGTVSVLLGVPVMLAWWPLRQRPGVGTLVNIVLIGVTIDLALELLPTLHSLTLRVAALLGGVLSMGLGAGLYLSAEAGAGPRDGLMLGLALRTGWDVRTVRTLIEVLVMLIGWLLGGTVGVGTLVFAFGIGPVVQASMRLFGAQVSSGPRPAGATTQQAAP